MVGASVRKLVQPAVVCTVVEHRYDDAQCTRMGSTWYRSCTYSVQLIVVCCPRGVLLKTVIVALCYDEYTFSCFVCIYVRTRSM